MRNYDELVTAATATGTFAEYVGDGYSVPWQCAIPIMLPAGVLMWAYKAYLDLRWPDGSKLHDWCYTPYGQLINVTKEEADLALDEFIRRDSPTDATIVWAAVTGFGGPFFGVSQTGYNGPQAEGALRNIALASLTQGNTTMPTKVILLINGSNPGGSYAGQIGYSGVGHSYGASESLWVTQGLGPSLNSWIRNYLVPKRAAFLASNCTIVAARLYQQGGGRGTLLSLGNVGQGLPLNHANDALMYSTTDPGVNPQRDAWFHFIPDEQVVNGEFRPTVFFQVAIANYFTLLQGYGQWISLVRNQLTPLISITQGGLITFNGANPFAVGQPFKLTRVFNPITGRKHGANVTVVTTGPLSTQCTVSGWIYGDGIHGQAYYAGTQFRSMGNGNGLFLARAGTRRVGRPFELYRGRKSVKR